MTDSESTHDNTLAHFGVKGMQWGKRKEDALGSSVSESDAKSYSDFGDRVHKDLEDRGISSEELRGKYDSTSSPFRLTPTKRKILLGVGVGAGVGLLAYQIGKTGKLPGADSQMRALENAKNKAFDDRISGMDLHWDKGIDLPSGSILSRVSPRKETSINPDGFYASFRADDLNRYKAILPTYWKNWGVGDARAGGFVNQFAANKAVKAPSGSDTTDIYRKLMETSKAFRESEGMFIPDNQVVSHLSSFDWKSRTQSASSLWSDPSDPTTKMFFAELKLRGYNAVIDFNNAGAISHSPLRVIDGTIFDVAGHAPLGLADMVSASNDIVKMVHDNMTTDDALAHYGVPGMRWGQTKKESRSDYKARISKEELEFNNTKMNDILQKAIKSGDKVLIQTRYEGDTVRTITTGKEFVTELSKGRAFDIKVTEIFANQTKEGPYQMTGERNQYVKTERGSA